MFDFGPGTFTGEEWATPNISVDTFAPTGLDIDQWLDAVVSAGGKYAALTTKHHDGFALWPTAVTVGENPPYSVAETTWYANNGSPDIVSLFVTKCREHNLNPVLYFSVWDRTYEARSGTDATTAWQSYMDMILAQITELLSNYGAISALWCDGWGNSNIGNTSIADLDFVMVWDKIKELQPNCLMIMNSTTVPNPQTQVETFEQAAPAVGNEYLGEMVAALRQDHTWFYDANESQDDASVRTLAEITTMTQQCWANNASALWGVTPSTAGVLPDAQVTRMGQMSGIS